MGFHVGGGYINLDTRPTIRDESGGNSNALAESSSLRLWPGLVSDHVPLRVCENDIRDRWI